MSCFSGRALRSARERKGLTREHLAHASGVSYPMLVSYESERNLPPVDKLSRLADALDVPVGDLFTDAADAA